MVVPSIFVAIYAKDFVVSKYVRDHLEQVNDNTE